MAQSAARILGKDEVMSSNLISSSKNRQSDSDADFYFLLSHYSLFTKKHLLLIFGK